jgi:hypothetical protein
MRILKELHEFLRQFVETNSAVGIPKGGDGRKRTIKVNKP